jgi:uncharacterized membrane protein
MKALFAWLGVGGVALFLFMAWTLATINHYSFLSMVGVGLLGVAPILLIGAVVGGSIWIVVHFTRPSKPSQVPPPGARQQHDGQWRNPRP